MKRMALLALAGMVAACGTGDRAPGAFIRPGDAPAGSQAASRGASLEGTPTTAAAVGGNGAGTQALQGGGGVSAATGPGGIAAAQKNSPAADAPAAGAPNGGATYQGVTRDTIKIVYFWTASQTENNPFLDALPGANANEAQAVRTWVEWINQRAGGGHTIMGFPFNLYGRKLELTVVDAGDYTNPEAQRAAADRIVKEIKPFVAFSNGGATSVRICPVLAAHKMLDIAVADLTFDMNKRTGGYCIPSFQSFNKQVDASVPYLARRWGKTQYAGPESGKQAVPRKFGFVYSELPDEVRSGPLVAQRLKDAGVPIAAVISMAGDLGTQQQQQAPGVVAQLRSAGVNTVIPLDALVPLTLTAAADSQAYNPDWYIWPCSGADYNALAHLYSQSQWSRARGLTCNDPDYSPDLVQDEAGRDSEWYRNYQTVDNVPEPPAQSALIYAHLHTILVGITNAGPNLTPSMFLKGLTKLAPKRYSFRRGMTTDPRNMLISLHEPNEHSMVGDFTELQWDASRRNPGSRFPGGYVYPDNARRFRADEL